MPGLPWIAVTLSLRLFFLTFIDYCGDLDRSVAIAAFVGKARSSTDGLEADLFGRVRPILQ